MNKNTRLLISRIVTVFFILLSGMFSASQIFASTDLNNAYMLPGVYATDVSITNTNGLVKGSFTAWNNEGAVMGGMQYTIKVLDQNGSLFAINPVRANFALDKKEHRTMQFSYDASKLPTGEYSFRIQIVTNNGRELGWGDTALSLNSPVDAFITTLPDGVVLPESNDQAFQPTTGPDVNPAGSLVLTAKLENTGGKSITATPVVTSHDFNIAKDEGTWVKANAITIAPGQKMDYRFPVTAAIKPGVYSGLLYFIDGNGQAVSSLAEYRWVVRGASADLMPLKVMQIGVKKSEQTIVNLDVVGSPDAQTAVNADIKVQITDNKGLLGEAEVKNVPLKDYVVSTMARLTLTRDLEGSPRLATTITESGTNQELTKNILDLKDVKNVNKTSGTSMPATTYIWFAIVIGVVIIVSAIMYMKKNNAPIWKNITLVFGMAVVSCLLFCGTQTFAVGTGNGIEVLTPVNSVVALFINRPINDAPTGTYQKNNVPLEYKVTYAVSDNKISSVRVIGRFDANGGKQSSFQGNNANWVTVHNKLYSYGPCININDKVCFRDDNYFGSVNLSALDSSKTSTTLQLVTKIGQGAGTNNLSPAPPNNDLSLSDPSISAGWAHAVNLWVNFATPAPTPTVNPTPTPIPTIIPQVAALSASCSGSPSSVNVGQLVNYAGFASGGTGNYTYQWSAGCMGSASNCSRTYTVGGSYTALLTVTSGTQTQNTACTVSVNQPQATPTPTPTMYPTPTIYPTPTFYPIPNVTLIATKMVRNITKGGSFASSTSASLSDVLEFNITVQNNSAQTANNVVVRDIFPFNLTYTDNLTLDGIITSGDIMAGLSLGNLFAGQVRTITYRAQVSPAQNFPMGTITLTNSVSVSATNASASANVGVGNVINVAATSSATVSVVRGQVLGATDVSTGLTNYFLVDSFFLPLILALAGVWLYKNNYIAMPVWVGNMRHQNQEARAQKELEKKIAQIKQNTGV